MRRAGGSEYLTWFVGQSWTVQPRRCAVGVSQRRPVRVDPAMHGTFSMWSGSSHAMETRLCSRARSGAVQGLRHCSSRCDVVRGAPKVQGAVLTWARSGRRSVARDHVHGSRLLGFDVKEMGPCLSLRLFRQCGPAVVPSIYETVVARVSYCFFLPKTLLDTESYFGLRRTFGLSQYTITVLLFFSSRFWELTEDKKKMEANKLSAKPIRRKVTIPGEIWHCCNFQHLTGLFSFFCGIDHDHFH
jgi:hypothetical protein